MSSDADRSSATRENLTTRTGHEADFTSFVRHHQHRLYGFACLLCGDRSEAEDLVQIAFAKAYLKWSRLGRDDFNAVGYVRKIIVNEYRGWWRRAWRRREHAHAELPDTAHHDPQTQLTDGLWPLVQDLPPRQREIVALRFYSDLSVTDTAALMHISEGAVKSQTSKALAKLKTRLTSTRSN